MREEMIIWKQKFKSSQKLWRQELVCCKNLKKELLKCKQHTINLQTKCTELQSNLKKYQLPKYSPKNSRKRKQWEEIKSVRTKYRRFNEYKDHLFSTLQEIKVCHRAEITMWLPENKISFSWSPKHFRQELDCTAKAKSSNLLSDHNYVRISEEMDDEDSFEDVNYSEIFDDEGNWRKTHIKRLIHVMDSFRISHQAYHELRMVSKGHLPSLGRITSQKKIMSEKIPYTLHPKVS